MTHQEYTLYLPKNIRKSIYTTGLELIKETDSIIYNELINGFKEDPPSGMVYVDTYKNNIIYFKCSKVIEVVKKYTYEKYGIHIVIKKVVIADIKSFEASHYPKELLHEPCGKDGDENYPSSIVFDEPI
jgi:hypothetical protein